MVDHLLLVPMYESHYKALPARVAKHKSKLRAFDFDVVYEANIFIWCTVVFVLLCIMI